jgi:hypothetical protein
MNKPLIAKPVVKDQFWIVTDGTEKVGNVLAEGSGFSVKLNGNKTHYKTTNAIKKQVKIEFEHIDKKKPVAPLSSYPTPSKTYNNVLDLKKKIHIFTKTPKSKCYHAAGWYVLNQNEPQVVFCPKYIFVQRYEFSGPYKTEQDATSALNNK